MSNYDNEIHEINQRIFRLRQGINNLDAEYREIDKDDKLYKDCVNNGGDWVRCRHKSDEIIRNYIDRKESLEREISKLNGQLYELEKAKKNSENPPPKEIKKEQSYSNISQTTGSYKGSTIGTSSHGDGDLKWFVWLILIIILGAIFGK